MSLTTNHGPARIRLDYLDGVRGLTALYVSLFHLTLTATWIGAYNLFPPSLSPAVLWVMQWFMFGHFGVSVFIILSGYCLMLPVARQRDLHLPGGTAAFLWRRARRVLPPYYAALGLTLLIARLPSMDHLTGARWDQALPAWEGSTILAHLLLVQNWNLLWYFKIDMPTWSVAPECQIYLMFPLLLLPLTRRMGMPATALVAMWLGVETHNFFEGRYDYVYWSYVGLFALGMLGAMIGFSEDAWARLCRERLPWGVIAGLAWAVVLRFALLDGHAWMDINAWLMDPVVGTATLCLLVFCTRVRTMPASAKPPFVLRLLQAKPLVLFGGFSFSYYLVHDPILSLLGQCLQPFRLAYTPLYCVMLGLGIPLCVAGAYGFHLVFERPFMPGRVRTAKQAADAAIVSPAP